MATITDWQTADAVLHHARTGSPLDSRKVANNTRLERRADGSIALRLHATDVVTYHADGTLTFDSGGWQTVTTRQRWNEYGGGFRFGMTAGTCSVGFFDRSRGQYGAWSPASVVYFDGITLDPSNPSASIAAAAASPDAIAAGELDRQDRETRKAVNAYCRKITREAWDAVLTRAQTDGTAGDCLYCQLVASNPDRSDIGGGDHLASHVAEGYVMATLGLAAVRDAGYRVPEAVLGYADLVRRATRRYLLSRLLVGSASDRRGNGRHVDADGYYGAVTA